MLVIKLVFAERQKRCILMGTISCLWRDAISIATCDAQAIDESSVDFWTVCHEKV